MELALIENLQREDLNPIEEAEGYKTLIETYHMTQEDAAATVGKSRPAVANSAAAVRLCPECGKCCKAVRTVPAVRWGHAALLPLKADLQLEAAAKVIVAGAERTPD